MNFDFLSPKSKSPGSNDHRRKQSWQSLQLALEDLDHEEIQKKMEADKKTIRTLLAQLKESKDENATLLSKLEKYETHQMAATDAEETKACETESPHHRTKSVDIDFVRELQRKNSLLEIENAQMKSGGGANNTNNDVFTDFLTPSPSAATPNNSSSSSSSSTSNATAFPPPTSDMVYAEQMERIRELTRTVDERNAEIERLNQEVARLTSEKNDAAMLIQHMQDEHDAKMREHDEKHQQSQVELQLLQEKHQGLCLELDQSKSDLRNHQESNGELQARLEEAGHEKEKMEARHERATAYMGKMRRVCEELTRKAEKLNLKVASAELSNIGSSTGREEEDVAGRMERSKQVVNEIIRDVHDMYSVDEEDDEMGEIVRLYQFSVLIVREKAELVLRNNQRLLCEMEKADRRAEAGVPSGSCVQDNLLCFLFHPQPQHMRR